MSLRGARRVATLGGALFVGMASAAGCLTRPVAQLEPTTKVSFTTAFKQTAVDKVDLLVLVDNSSSMGDKQAYLSQAVPDLVKRLVQPA